MLKQTGVPSKDQVFSKFPDIALLKRPKVVIECYEEIPCNPCESVCPVGAIIVGEDINHIPVYDANKCTSCTKCISICPGQAIMMVEASQDFARFKIPYEFYPVPVKGEIWDGLDREGKYISDVKIISVIDTLHNDLTKVVTLEIGRQYLYDFRAIRCKNGK